MNKKSTETSGTVDIEDSIKGYLRNLISDTSSVIKEITDEQPSRSITRCRTAIQSQRSP